MLVSVIVPVYNAEQSIIKCVNSILLQTYSEIEVIVINDGSIDNTVDCLSTIVDKRMNIYTTENQGALYARIYGINKSKGDYIMFVDADDWIEPNMIKILISNSNCNSIDFIMCGLEKNVKNKYIPVKINKKELYGNSNIRHGIVDLFLNESINGPCCKLMKRSIFSDMKFEFDKNIMLQEDLMLNIEILKRIESFVSIPNCLYHYVYNKNSATHKYVENKFFMTNHVYEKIEEFFLDLASPKELNDIRWIYFKNFYAAIIDLHLPDSHKKIKEKYKLIKKFKESSHMIEKLAKVSKHPYQLYKKILINLLRIDNDFLLYMASYLMYILKYKINYKIE